MDQWKAINAIAENIELQTLDTLGMLVKFLECGYPIVNKIIAAKTIGIIGHLNAKSSVTSLIKSTLDSDDKRIKIACIDSLSGMGFTANSSIPVLTSLCESADEDIRNAACTAIVYICLPGEISNKLAESVYYLRCGSFITLIQIIIRKGE